MFRPFPAILASVMALLFIISCTPSASPPPAAGDVKTFRSSLEKDGFSVKLAPFVHVDLINLYEAGKLANSGGNNANAPYRGIFGSIPDSANITDPAQFVGAEDKINKILYQVPGLIQGWQIDPDEAIVIVTKTPPECVYFSYTGFIFNKYYEETKECKWVWTSYNDPLNHLTIKTSGTPDGAKGNPFNQDTVIIITSDKGTDSRVRRALVSAGYSEDIINTYVIPSSMVRLGIGPESDTVVFGQRMALFTDEKAGQAYVEAVTAAYRVNPSGTALDPFPAPTLRVRGTGHTEIDLRPAMEELRQAILKKYAGFQADELKTSVWLTESYDAVQTATYVAGESRDTVYLRSETLTLGDNPDEFIIVYGVNHAATGKATYANSNFYGEAAWNGVSGLNSPDYTGTAEAFLPGHPQAKYLYVIKFARAPGSEKGYVMVPTGPKAHGVGLTEPAFIGFRAYCEPATRVGPVFTELLYDQVIKFQPRK